jgi:acyl-coenzyme A thioesterase PaaI-like protein
MTNLTRPSELVELIDARFDEATPTQVSGSIAADERHHQPWGIVHGGLYTAAIETFATIGAYEAVKTADSRQSASRTPPTSCAPTMPDGSTSSP